MAVTTTDPASGRPIATYAETPSRRVDAILERARDAAGRWRETPVEMRMRALRDLAVRLRSRRDDLARLATREMGKPIRESLAEVDKCASACDWFADRAPAMLEPEEVETGALRTRVVHAPLGVVFAIMPWNFPYWQVVRAVAPALAAGNVVVLKHATATTGCALRLLEIAGEAGWAEGLLSVLVVSAERTPEVSERVILDDRVAAVTLTGSTRAGRAVAAIAGRALKKAVLELGGSDPFLVLADADIGAAATWAVRSRFQNSGQSCIAAKRIIVEEGIAERFMERLLGEVARLRLGDPADPEVDLGPLAREDLRDTLDRQVRASVAAGARVLAGGRVPDLPGYYYEPTVLDRVTPGMPVLEEEVFGPAVPVLRAGDADEAVRLANASPFGLGSNVWTADLGRGEAIAARLDAGHTAVNGMTASDPRLPFGGIKASGHGRELSHHGLHEFVNAHVVVVHGPGGPGSARPGPPPAQPAPARPRSAARRRGSETGRTSSIPTTK